MCACETPAQKWGRNVLRLWGTGWVETWQYLRRTDSSDFTFMFQPTFYVRYVHDMGTVVNHRWAAANGSVPQQPTQNNQIFTGAPFWWRISTHFGHGHKNQHQWINIMSTTYQTSHQEDNFTPWLALSQYCQKSCHQEGVLQSSSKQQHREQFCCYQSYHWETNNGYTTDEMKRATRKRTKTNTGKKRSPTHFPIPLPQQPAGLTD